MQPLWTRVLRHSAWVGITLAVVGYVLGKGFLMAHRIYSGGAYNPDNERVLWQTPVVMAALGVLMSVGLDLLISSVRRPAPVKVAAEPPAPTPGV